MALIQNADGSVTLDRSAGTGLTSIGGRVVQEFVGGGGLPPLTIVQSTAPSVGITPPTSVVANPGNAVEALNAEVSLSKNSDGSVAGRIPGTNVVVNLSTKAVKGAPRWPYTGLSTRKRPSLLWFM
jgi:hypothetical protein